MNNKTKYNEYIAAIKNYRCELIDSKISDGQIEKIYRGASTTFIVISSTGTSFYNKDTAVWRFVILPNSTYDDIMESKG